MQEWEERPGFQTREREPARDAFMQIPELAGFSLLAGPYQVAVEEGLARLGFEVTADHCNPNGALHGGALATFLDTQLAIAGRIQARIPDRFLVTISLSIDFAAGPVVGDWVVGRGDVVRRTRNMVFVHGLASVRSIVVARASGVFRIGPEFKQANTVSNLARQEEARQTRQRENS